jgi:hypothetical protein
MEIEIAPENNNRALNRAVAVTVVVLSVFLGLATIKDGNLVQAMQQAKADAVDTWGEYQAAKTKLHIVQVASSQIELLRLAAPGAQARGAAEAGRLAADTRKYEQEIPELSRKARDFEKRYDELNFHDDQFDVCDALVSIAISAAAVAALTETLSVLIVAWVFGALGMLMGLAGFFGWMLHPDVLTRLLS